MHDLRALQWVPDRDVESRDADLALASIVGRPEPYSMLLSGLLDVEPRLLFSEPRLLVAEPRLLILEPRLLFQEPRLLNSERRLLF